MATETDQEPDVTLWVIRAEHKDSLGKTFLGKKRIAITELGKMSALKAAQTGTGLVKVHVKKYNCFEVFK